MNLGLWILKLGDYFDAIMENEGNWERKFKKLISLLKQWNHIFNKM